MVILIITCKSAACMHADTFENGILKFAGVATPQTLTASPTAMFGGTWMNTKLL